MATVRPFRALRPRPEAAGAIASVPYDVINTEEARALIKGKPHSFLRVVRSESELAPEVDPYSEEVYLRAKRNLERLIEEQLLIEDPEAAFYVYQLQMGGHTQLGIVGCSSVDEYDEGLVKLHEKTRPDKEDDRTRHILTLRTHTGPVFLAYRGLPALTSLMQEVAAEDPLYDVTAEDGVRHTIWRTTRNEEIERLFKQLPHTYIADGHHRAKSASRARSELREKNAGHTGSEQYNFFLSVLFPGEQLRILPYNRIVKSLPAGVGGAERLLASLREVCTVTPDASPEPARKGTVSLYLEGKWHGIELPASGSSDPVASLDASLLQEKILEPIFGIGDPRTDKNIDFIGGIRGTAELVRLVDAGKAACAFSMYPVTIEDLFTVADRGLTMPPKSTWFEPKLRSGLLINRF